MTVLGLVAAVALIASARSALELRRLTPVLRVVTACLEDATSRLERFAEYGHTLATTTEPGTQRIGDELLTMLTETTHAAAPRAARPLTSTDARVFSAGADFVGTDPARTTLGVRGWELSSGTVKISHEHNDGDAFDGSASVLSLRVNGKDSHAQGIYLETSSAGKAINFRRVFPDGTRREFFTLIPPDDAGAPAKLYLNGKQIA